MDVRERESSIQKKTLSISSSWQCELTGEFPPFHARLVATILLDSRLKRKIRRRPETHFHILILAGDRISGRIKTSHFVRGNYTGRLPRRANKQGCQLTPGGQIKACDWQGNTQTAACQRRPSLGLSHCGSLVYTLMCTRRVPRRFSPSVECYECSWKMGRNQRCLWGDLDSLRVRMLRVNGAEQQRCSNAPALVVLAVGRCRTCTSCVMSIKTLPLSLTKSLYHLFWTFLNVPCYAKSIHPSSVPASSCTQGCMGL